MLVLMALTTHALHVVEALREVGSHVPRDDVVNLIRWRTADDTLWVHHKLHHPESPVLGSVDLATLAQWLAQVLGEWWFVLKYPMVVRLIQCVPFAPHARCTPGRNPRPSVPGT